MPVCIEHIIRLEIWSPGGLPYGMTAEKITQMHRSLPVNPILAHSVYLSGYIERLGTGTVDLIERCKEKGLKTPEFHFDEDGRVVIWSNLIKQVYHYR